MSSSGAKKAVHVKWAGKTIALGTFPLSEADEKCARAKALTRAWRSTMRPKPTREWVMLELERLNVRVVSGRAVKEEEFGGDDGQGGGGAMNPPNCADPNLVGRRGSITASLLNAADMARASGGEWSADNGLGGFDPAAMQRRNASLSMMGDLSKQDENSVPPHRPLVGGGSAAAYEAARAEHYRELAEKKNKDQSTGSSGMDGVMSNGMGVMSSNGLGGGMQQNLGGPSINANQHYEMLKLHHMNLLNEIQETTLMMNIYQQQQLQQQQQQQMQEQQLKEQQQKQQQQMQQMQNAAQYNSQQNRMSQISAKHSSNNSHSSNKDVSHTKGKKNGRSPKTSDESDQPSTIKSQSSDDVNDKGSSREEKLAKIKAEIEERQRLLEDLAGGDDEPASKRTKTAV